MANQEIHTLREFTAFRFVWFVNGKIVTACDGSDSYDYMEETTQEYLAELGEDSLAAPMTIVENITVPAPYTALLRTVNHYQADEPARYYLVH